jgi:hypothetical protein
MFRTALIATALAVAAVTPALATDLPPAGQDNAASAPEAARKTYEPNGPVTTATHHTTGSEHRDFTTAHGVDREAAGWTSDSDTTSSRVGGRASTVRVVRACEISLTLDGDCTAN